MVRLSQAVRPDFYVLGEEHVDVGRHKDFETLVL
jgi:hypothetical protein